VARQSGMKSSSKTMPNEIAFEMATSSIRFGWGVTAEIGMDLAELKAKKVMVLTDPQLRFLPPVSHALESLDKQGIPFKLFERVRVEPTDLSFQEAIRFATEEGFDAFVAVGGGSTIDTAKAANLYSTYPADFLDYVNPPVGKGLPVPGPLKPLIAVPTTAGTGSETTGVAIFDRTKLRAKTGIAHRRLKPTLGIIDPENTRTQPPAVAASAGLDVLSHALESYTAIPFSSRPYPDRPIVRPAYQGSNPISDLWSMEALRLVSQYLIRAVENPSDDEARAHMLLAACYAGVGFGNAGVHLPHGMSYPVSGMVREFRPEGYVTNHPMVPHGISVILNAPSVFRFTAPACPERHLKAAEMLGADISQAKATDAGKILSDQIIGYMQKLKVPNGLSAVGYGRADIAALVQGTLPQHRVTKLSPRPASEEDLADLFENALTYW
jgi:hydroxyacid-oxoacid transhydrogenase